MVISTSREIDALKDCLDGARRVDAGGHGQLLTAAIINLARGAVLRPIKMGRSSMQATGGARRNETRWAAADTQLKPSCGIEMDCETQLIDVRQEIPGRAAATG